MNYKLAMIIIGEIQTLLALVQSPDARWNAVQDWLKANPRWKDEIDYYLTLTPDEALDNLRLFLIEQTDVPGQLIALAITPAIEAQARSAIERLQTLYRERANHNQNQSEQQPEKEIKNVRRKRVPTNSTK